jgi:hypothetical protein
VGCPARSPSSTAAPAAPATRPATLPSAGPAQTCRLRNRDAELWRAPCAFRGSRLVSADGVLDVALEVTAAGYRMDGRFRGAPVAGHLFAIDDALAAALVVDGAVAELLAPRPPPGPSASGARPAPID